MEELVIALMRTALRYDERAKLTDAKLERNAANARLPTAWALARVEECLAEKRALAAAVYVCREILSLLTARERAVLIGKLRGEAEESIAARLGLCRKTVHAAYVHLLNKSGWFLGALADSGYDISVLSPIADVTCVRVPRAETRAGKRARRG